MDSKEMQKKEGLKFHLNLHDPDLFAAADYKNWIKKVQKLLEKLD